MQRRSMMQAATAIALSMMAGRAIGSSEPADIKAARKGDGKPGDFSFLTGEWRIANRMIKPGTKNEWIEFPGEATVWSILGGVVSIEELRIPAREFSGMGLRALDMDRRIWSDHWVNSKSGVVFTPGQEGVFVNGVGAFTSEETLDGVRHIYRGVWDRITPTSCRWFQSASSDGGDSWSDSWFMDWTRVA